MKIFRADLHIHSRFSRATSKKLTIPYLAAWSRIKGINVLATGDITHPSWREELKKNLEYDENSGLYSLKPEYKKSVCDAVMDIPIPTTSEDPLFMLQGEISSIYKKDGAVRKVHNIVYMPSFEAADMFCSKLEEIGNLKSDGRPILGLDSRDLLEILLCVDERAVLIPAHIWTPWFSVFGSRSGFNSLDACFGDLTSHIFALETGLSSDPDMNRLWSHLDRCALISNSDAHSGENLGREANLFLGEPSYNGIFASLKNSALGDVSQVDSMQYMGTVEFFPDEGKYYLDGHRACGVVLNPKDSMALGNICPVCNKPLTVGVLHRVLELADRVEPKKDKGSPPHYGFIPLSELLGELLSVGSKSKKVVDSYSKLIERFGPELDILHSVPEHEISQYWSLLGEAISRMRSGNVIREGGYDGEYGTVRVFSASDREHFGLGAIKSLSQKKQMLPIVRHEDKQESTLPLFDSIKMEHLVDSNKIKTTNVLISNRAIGTQCIKQDNKNEESLNKIGGRDMYSDYQRKVIQAGGVNPVLVYAGPGSGKTRTLVGRVSYLLDQGMSPEAILIITYTRRAAEELLERVQEEIKHTGICISTLHALGLAHLREKENRQPHVLSEDMAKNVFVKANTGYEARLLHNAWTALTLAREKLIDPLGLANEEYPKMFEAYRTYKQSWNMVDYTDLLEQWLCSLQNRDKNFFWKAVLIDEIQDFSLLQIEIVKALCPIAGKGFFGIGDPDQAIYGFRGADLDIFGILKEAWPAIELHTLKENYRSAKEINMSAQAVLGEAIQSGKLVSIKRGKASLQVFSAPDSRREASWVGNKITQLIGYNSHSLTDIRSKNDVHPLAGMCSPGDIAILVRTKVLMPLFQEALGYFGIPCIVPEAEPFWRDNGVSLLLGLAGRKLGRPFGAQAVPDPTSIPDHVWSGGPCALLSWLENIPPFSQEFRDTKGFKGLVSAYTEQGSWGALLEWLSLRQEIDLIKRRCEHVQIMTMHAAKGLEFKVVFLPCAEEGILPFFGTQHILKKGIHSEDSETLAEERRLLYVGITRAEEALFITHAKERVLYGKTVSLPPSRFLGTLPKVFQKIQMVKKTKVQSSQRSLLDI